MTARALLLALALVTGPALAATEAPTEDSEETEEAPTHLDPIPVLAPVPSTGLSEDVLDRMRSRLVEDASGPRQQAGE